MKNFHPEVFFDLSDFSHRTIFDRNTFVWEVLQNINEYLQTQTLGQIDIDIPIGAFLVRPELISIGKDTVVEPGAFIQGPCIIGKHCQIRHGAYVRGNVITGDEVVLGHGSECKNALLLDSAHAAHFAYVGDSVLGNRVNLGAGTILANLRLDKGLVSVVSKGTRINTGLKKFGAILGDDAQTGCNTVTNPGTLFRPRAATLPCRVVGGVVGEKKEE